MTHKHTLRYVVAKTPDGYIGEMIDLENCFTVGDDMAEFMYSLNDASLGYLEAFPDVHEKLCAGTLPKLEFKPSLKLDFITKTLDVYCTAPVKEKSWNERHIKAAEKSEKMFETHTVDQEREF